jgi:queuine tRNA-ribosyltransferase
MAIPEVSVHDLRALGEDAHVVDVRELDEWERGHIAHASHVPLATVPDELGRLDGVTTDLICHSGGRSGRAAEFAAARGHDVVNVTGGMSAWSAAGYDVVTGG